MKEVNSLVITECVSCESSDLMEKKANVISNDINKLEEVDALVCSICGTIHAVDGSWFQKNIKQNTTGYTKTTELNSGKIKNWN